MKDMLKSGWFFAWVQLAGVGCFLIAMGMLARSDTTISNSLTLAKANAAITASGWGPGRVFADGDNRYLVSRAQFVSKRGSVFVGEIEIKPLPKHPSQ